MANALSNIIEQARLTSQALYEYGQYLFEPTVRLGVTGLSRAGKTVFITALVHGLLRGGRFPVFEALSGGRIARARLSPQPDDTVPRFAYEAHLESLIKDRQWPESTKAISELRLVIEYQSHSGSMRELTLDIVDYPGEWLLDLPLLGMSYEDWSAETIRLSQQPDRVKLAEAWHRDLASLDPAAPESEPAAQKAAQIFTEYLRACRDERFALSLLPPGRFLMPGELADSPALTFAPLDRLEGEAARGSQHAMMRRRYDSYKDLVVRPFYRDHIARLDRQIVLVDVLTALNAGPAAVRDLERAMTAILDSFNVGRNSILSCKNGDIELADGANIGFNCEVFSASRVTIGASVLMAAYSYIIGGDHAFSDPTAPVLAQERTSAGVEVGAGAWLGAGAKILDGVRIGEHAIVGAAAVVRDDVPAHAVAAGVPARVISRRD